MICKRCGNINPRNSRYCRHCGAHLEQPGAVLPLPEEEFNLDSGEGAEPSPNQEEVNRLLERAFGLSERGDLTGAAFLCTQAIDLDPRSVSAHSLLGLLYERMGRREEAIVEYQRVVELNPASRVDREHLAQLQGAEPASPPPSRPNRSPTLGWFGQSPYLSAVPIVAAVSLGIVFILLANRAAESGFGRRARLNGAKGGPVAQLVQTGVKQLQAGQYAAAEDSFRAALMLDAGNRDAQLWLQRVERLQRPRLASARHEAPHLVGPPLPPQSRATQPKASPPPNRTVPTPPPPLIPPSASAAASPVAPRTPTAGAGAPAQPQPQPSRTPPVTPRRAVGRSTTAPPLQPFRPAAPRGNSGEGRSAGPSAPADTGHIVIRTTPGKPTAKSETTRPSKPPAASGRSSSSGRDARSLEVEAAKSYLNGDVAAAEQRYQRSLETISPDDPKAAFVHQQLATLHFNRGDYAGARTHYEQALAAYRRQLKQGIRVEEAKSGIRACESALRVCNAATTR